MLGHGHGGIEPTFKSIDRQVPRDIGSQTHPKVEMLVPDSYEPRCPERSRVDVVMSIGT